MAETIDYTRTITQDTFLEIAKGNVPGSSIVQIVGQGTSVGNIHVDIFDGIILSTLDFDAQTANFTAGLLLTGAGGATAWIVAQKDDGATGTLWVRNITGTFVDNELITDSSTGSADLDEPVSVQNQVRAVHEPSAGEQWEIVCESTDDAIAGTGARVALVTFMEEGTRLYTTEIIALNGITPVSFTSADAYRLRSIQILSWGSATHPVFNKTNLGNIIVRDSVTKSVAGMILYDTSVTGDDHGLNGTFNSNYTVEGGTTGYPVFIVGNSAKDNDVSISTMGKFDGIEGWFFVGELASYQNTFDLNVDAPAAAPEKTGLKFVAKSDNAEVTVNTQLILILVEDGA